MYVLVTASGCIRALLVADRCMFGGCFRVYRIAVQDLSIHRLRAAEADTTAGRFMQQMLTSLEFPSYRVGGAIEPHWFTRHKRQIEL